MTISAKMICDSISPKGVRLSTLELYYPKFIHGEFMTHRIFSRNASSSRAIPIERMLEQIRDDPAMPVEWGRNQKGMQAKELLSADEANAAKAIWLASAFSAYKRAKLLANAGAHKQIVNRIVEPFAHIRVVVTATDFDNFFALRCHPDAQPEMRTLAVAMREAMGKSIPYPLDHHEWHLPYIQPGDFPGRLGSAVDWNELLKVSVARCARTSYLTHDGRPTTVQEDVWLYDRLLASRPLHASPAEHQAKPDIWLEISNAYERPDLHGNLHGWRQYRKTLPFECEEEHNR
jgi:thymidylate synthase ThyX